MIHYQIVDRSQVEHLFPQGEKEGLSFVPGTLYVAAFSEDEVIGYAGLKVRGKQATLRNLYVVADRRGQGIAKALTAHCLEWARSLGASHAIAFSNWNSKPMYLSMGAVEIQSTRYYGKIRFNLGEHRERH